MNLSEYLKPALGVAFVAVLGGGYYWFEHRSRPEAKDTPTQALVIVTKSTNACFSDMVRVTGFIVPRREAQIGVDQEGSRVTDLFVREGDMVNDNQELARLTAPPQQPGAQGGGRTAPVSLRAPAAGLVTEVRTAVGAPASPQAGPMFRISVNNEIELEPKCRASICSSSIRARRCGSAATTHPIWSARSGRFPADRSRHPARPCPDIADQQSLAQGRHVRPRQYRRQAQLRRRRARTAIDRLTLQVVKDNTWRRAGSGSD
jgi:Membrane-fusion protein